MGMFNTRSTFNALIQDYADAGVPIHMEPSEVTAYPSYRLTWMDEPDDSTVGMQKAVVQVDINVAGGDTAGLYRRAQALETAIGLAVHNQPPRLLKMDWSNVYAPVAMDAAQEANWIRYRFRRGRRWVSSQPNDPDARMLSAQVELEFYTDA